MLLVRCRSNKYRDYTLPFSGFFKTIYHLSLFSQLSSAPAPSTGSYAAPKVVYCYIYSSDLSGRKDAVVVYVKHTGVFVLYMAISYPGSEYCVRTVITRNA